MVKVCCFLQLIDLIYNLFYSEMSKVLKTSDIHSRLQLTDEQNRCLKTFDNLHHR